MGCRGCRRYMAKETRGSVGVGKITEEMAEASIGTEEKKIAPTKKNKNTMRLNLIKLEISFASTSP